MSLAGIPATVAGDTFTMNGLELEIAESCGGSTGQWLCTTHGVLTINNLTMEGHCERGKHTLAWVCAEHGPEQP